MTNKLLNHYNHGDTTIVVTSYPQKGSTYAGNQDAVASFAKNRILALKKVSPQIVVLTNYHNQPQAYTEDGILILRLYKRNQPHTLFKLLLAISKLPLARNVLIEFEFATFGDTLTTLVFPLLLGALRLMGKKVTVELHQVVTDLHQIHGHLGSTSNSLKLSLLNIPFRIFYRALGYFSNHIITLDYHLKKQLSTFINPQKISVLPHGVDLPKTITSTAARKKLGLKKEDFIVLNFGFLTWYKGSDLMVDAFKDLQDSPNLKLLLAGGMSFTQKNKRHYRRFYRQTIAAANKLPNITSTGFIPENELAAYFAAADLVVLPYRTFMSASGPFSLALSYGKPVIISDQIKNYLLAPDAKKQLADHKLKSADLTFDLAPQQIAAKVKAVSANKKLLKKLAQFSSRLAEVRSFDQLAIQQLQTLNRSTTPSTLLNLTYGQAAS